MFAEIPREFAWGVLFRLSWCWLLLCPFQFIRTGLPWILDFLYLGSCYLVQEVLVLFFFLCVVFCIQKCIEECTVWQTHLAIWWFSSELNNNCSTGLPHLCPSWIYCTGKQHKVLYFQVCSSVFSFCVYCCCVMDHAYHSHKSFVHPHLNNYVIFHLEHSLPCFQVVGFLF